MTNITQHIMSLISFFNADQTFFHIYPGELNQSEVIFYTFCWKLIRKIIENSVLLENSSILFRYFEVD